MIVYTSFRFMMITLEIADTTYQVKRAFLIMARQKSPKQLSKFISYMLGRKPAEFGLVPDQDGFVKIKEFIKARMNNHEGVVPKFYINCYRKWLYIIYGKELKL